MSKQGAVEDFLRQLLREPEWTAFLSAHGVGGNITLTAPITVKRDLPGCADFMRAPGGDRLITPGDPAASFLYHCLASPGVNLGSGVRYAEIDELQLVEDYIYSLATVSPYELGKLVPAVLCYEYREAASTAHRQHADFVFSRTGVARIGNAPALFSGRYRTFVLEADAPHEVRCLPARYGLFLCEARKGHGVRGQYLGQAQAGDDSRMFLVPKLKVVADQILAGSPVERVTFESFHSSDRIKRLFTVGGLPTLGDPQLDRPPYTRTTVNGGLAFENRSFDNGYLVSQTAGPLVQEALISAGNSAGQVRRAGTEVPPKGVGVPQFNENRRYSTLRVGQELLSAGLDYVGSEISGAALYRSPRNCPEFINIRHKLSADLSQVEDLNLRKIGSSEFQALVNAGNFEAALYLDSICDGFVRATFHWSGHLNTATSAFSVVTAPDFFPCIKNLDLQKFGSNCREGGPSPLCEGRLQANVHSRDPATGAIVFGDDDTIAAAVCTAPRGTPAASPFTQLSYEVATALTDGASNIFAPGWDVTYGRDGLFSKPYYHTAGLGCPFVEDVKLCAAANGMWAAASPDASRTFARKTPTAMPLTDEELGIHPDSPLRGFVDEATRGWDGEQGPFFCAGTNGTWGVNYADIWRSDYVTNAMRGLMRYDLLRRIARPEMERRMSALQAAIAKLEGKDVKNATGWLVSFRASDTLGDLSPASVLPAAHPMFAQLEAFLLAFVTEKGYFFAFASLGSPIECADPSRLFIEAVQFTAVVIDAAGAHAMH